MTENQRGEFEVRLCFVYPDVDGSERCEARPHGESESDMLDAFKTDDLADRIIRTLYVLRTFEGAQVWHALQDFEYTDSAESSMVLRACEGWR